MSSLAKCSKGSNIKQCNDRITSLPSCLLTKILSCLPTKDAVATSVLSTKWKRSWMPITNLDFDDETLVGEHSNMAYMDANIFRKFSDFVTRVLLLRERSCLQRVSLKCYHDYGGSLVNAWLSAIVHGNVQELDIVVWANPPGLSLSSDIFRCNSLVVLKIYALRNVSMPISTSTCLPALKTLYISRVKFDDKASFPSLLSGCPVLEELILCECVGADVQVVNITSRVLKKFTFHSLPDNWFMDKYQIFIDTPALEYLSFNGNIGRVHVKDLTNLIEAEIKLDCFCVYQFKENYSQAIKDFFSGISHVHNLVISEYSLQPMELCDLVLPKFDDLTCLKFHTCGVPGWRLLAKMLQNSPCLQILYMKQGDEDNVNVYSSFPFHDVPSCFLSHLKEVKIDRFQDDDEMEVEYILKNGQVLEKLTLHYTSMHDEICPDFAKNLEHAKSFSGRHVKLKHSRD